MKVAKHAVVSVHYTLKDDDGDELDTSAGSDPLMYLHGADDLIPGLEKEMDGKSVGDAFKVDVQPEEAYGDHQVELVQTVPRAMFEGVENIEAGMMLEAQAEDGTTHHLMVADVDGDNISVDRNHPLAGIVLHFDVEIVEIREGTEEEIAHGHPHSESEAH